MGGTTPRPNFERVRRARAAEQAMLQQAGREGLVASDIAEALADPAVSDWLLYSGFQVVSDLAALAGPDSGVVELQVYLVDAELGPQVDLSNAWQRVSLYRRVLVDGSESDQAALLNRGLLRELWPQRLAPSQILRVWEGRFPELAEAARGGA